MARSEKQSTPTRSSLSTRRRPARPAAPGGGEVSTAAAAVGRAVVEETVENSLAASQNLTAWLAQWRQLNGQAVSFWSEAVRETEQGQESPLAWNWAQWLFLPAELAQRQLTSFWTLLGGGAFTHQDKPPAK